MIFACHSPSKALAKRASMSGLDLWFGETLARKAVETGMFGWLVDRVR